MLNARSLRLLVFDWDGTLMDSAAKIVNCFNGAAMTCNQELPEGEAVRRLIGIDLHEMFRSLYPGIGQDVVEALVESYREFWITLDNTPMPLFPGVCQGLKQLDDMGFELAVATGKSRRGLKRALAETDLEALFSHTRCADESRPKPDPAMLLELMNVSGRSNTESLMIGDTTFDLEMARRAGMRAVGVGYGYHSREMLATCGEHPVVASFGELVSGLTP